MFGLDGLNLQHFARFLLDSQAGRVFSHAQTACAMICCFAILLFVTRDFIVGPYIILLVQQALRGRSIVTFIFAETLNELDGMAIGRSEFLRGSLILLYMWLLEHFLFMSNKNVGLTILRNPARFFSRTLLLGGRRDSYDWTEVFAEITKYIRWHMPWWLLS